jgi:hypothetical protein
MTGPSGPDTKPETLTVGTGCNWMSPLRYSDPALTLIGEAASPEAAFG